MYLPRNSGSAIEETAFREKEISRSQTHGNYMKHEPQPFANLDGILVVKALFPCVNLRDRGVAHLAQHTLEFDRLARRDTHGVVRHINLGQRRIGTANQKNTNKP